ncbi:MAG: hypothetical protein CL983_07060 [Euryarchaeota archaeon]|nr:hypothetical protein [Euryarchaeota archaeon]
MNKKINRAIKKRTNELIVILLLISMSFSGCFSSEQESDQEHDFELNIATYDVYALTDEMIENFENQTGIKVTMTKLGDSGSVLDFLIQNKGNNAIDLAIGLDNTYLQIAIEQGILIEHIAENLENISQKALTPYDGPLAVPFDMGHVCLNYDSNIVDGLNMTIPTNLWNLTEEKWRGKVAIPSPVSSSPGRAFMLATIDYFSNSGNNNSSMGWEQWWSAMEENDVIITSGWSEAYETHYTGGYGEWTEGYIGDAHVTVSYCHSPGVESWFNDNWTKSATLDIPGSSFFQVEYASSVAGGNNIASSLFIEYLLSEEVNSEMPIQNSMYSVLEGQDLPEEKGYLYHSTIPQDSAQISMLEIAENMELWLQKWNNAMTSGD